MITFGAQVSQAGKDTAMSHYIDQVWWTKSSEMCGVEIWKDQKGNTLIINPDKWAKINGDDLLPGKDIYEVISNNEVTIRAYTMAHYG